MISLEAFRTLSIETALGEPDFGRFGIIKPRPGHEISPVCLWPDAPVPVMIAANILEMPLMSATPAHIHWKKLKHYFFVGGPYGAGIIDVMMNIGDTWVAQTMTSHRDHITIDPGVPHAVVCRYAGEGQSKCRLIVVAYPNDPKDIDWEPKADLLIQEHPLRQQPVTP